MTKTAQANKPATGIEAAEQTVARLMDKREKLLAERLRLESELSKHSYAAHAGNDAKAVAVSDEITTAMSRIDGQVRGVDLAIIEAQERVKRAEAAEDAKAVQAHMAEARKTRDELAPAFAYLDRHLDAAANAVNAIHNGVGRFHELGFTSPSDTQIRIALVAIIQTWAHRLPKHIHNELRSDFRFLAPHERRTGVEYWRGVEAMLRQHIGENAQADKETV